MNRTVKSARTGIRRIFALLARRRLLSNHQWNDNVWKAERSALLRCLNNSFEPEEAAWMARIESIRRELEGSKDFVNLIKYGAQEGDHRSPEAPRQRMALGKLCRRRSKKPFWAQLLFSIVRHRRPERALELGCCLGISAAYQAAAMELNGGPGKLITLEGEPDLVERARNHFEALGLGNRVEARVGRFIDTLDAAAKDLAPIDYAFIDGHHLEAATLRYFDQIKPYLADQALVVFDDIAWSREMKRAWRAIQADRIVKGAIDLGAMGLAIIDTAASSQGNLRLPLRQP